MTPKAERNFTAVADWQSEVGVVTSAPQEWNVRSGRAAPRIAGQTTSARCERDSRTKGAAVLAR
jgi:hypothetical protein